MRRTLLLLTLLAFLAPWPARADDQLRTRAKAGPPVLEASGEGSVSVAPDLATLTLGVVTQAPSAKDAAEENARAMAAVVQALAQLGVTGKDVRTQAIDLTPVYENRPNEAPRVRGYRASNQVVVSTSNLGLVGQLLDETTRAGANVTGGLRFGLRDANAAQTLALREATREALARATAMADAIGKRLTRVVEIKAVEGATPRAFAPEAFRAVAAATAPPVEPGELTVHARVLLRAEFQ